MQSKDLRRLSESSKSFASGRKGVLDIALFGSAAKGKARPGDIDIAIIADKAVDRSKLTGAFSRQLSEQGIDAHVSTLFTKDVLSEPLWAAVLHEGVSLITGEHISKSLGYTPKTMFQYDASGLPPLKRVTFQYALVGRDGKGGLVAETKGEKLSGGVVMIPTSSESTASGFFGQWGVPYKIKRLMAE